MNEVLERQYYHVSTNRMKSEEILQAVGKDGAFMVRNSESITNAHVLSLLFQSGVRHYRILQTLDKKFTLQASEGVQQCFFESLSHLISYYMVPGQDKGLPIELRFPVEEEIEKPQEYEEYSDDEEEIFGRDDPVAIFFQQQLDAIKAVSVDGVFREHVEHYVRKHLVSDVEKIQNGAVRPPYFQILLMLAAGQLERDLNLFQRRLNFLQELFDVGTNTGLKRGVPQKLEENGGKVGRSSEATDLESMINLLTETKTAMLMTERRAYKALMEYCSTEDFDERKTSIIEHETIELIDDKVEVDGRPRNDSTKDRLKINKLFHVTTTGAWKTKQILAVDVKRGNIHVKKSVDEISDSGQLIRHDQVRHILKSKVYKSKLAISLENKAMKNYMFEDFKSRELFCQFVQQMKNLHSSSTEKRQLSLFIGSWNMGDSPPPTDLTSWFHCQGLGKTKDASVKDIPYDLVAFGAQETPFHEKELINKLTSDLNKAFNCTYKLVAACSLWSLRLVIFIKSELSNKVTMIKQSSVKTGIANTLGNKGATAIAFNYDSTSFCFINCHLTSGAEKLKRRNENFHDILRGLRLGTDGLFDVTLKFNHCFWFGDLNYRIHADPQLILDKIAKNHLADLLEKDQLCMEKKEGNAFFGYSEAPITFRPTYRYRRGETHMYSVSKVKRTGIRINVPSWCDRVLWRSYPGIYVENTAYGCTEDILTSDHFPIFAAFDVGTLLQGVLDHDCDTSQLTTKDVKISLTTIQAKVRTSCTTKFILELESPCLEERLASHPNSFLKWKSFKKDGIKEESLYSFPEWTQTDLPLISPVLSYQRFLEDQHLLVAIKGEDGHESYGECCISFKDLLASEFACTLTHLGYESGILRGTAMTSIPTRSEKSVYRDRDLISVADLDEEHDRDSVESQESVGYSLDPTVSFSLDTLQPGQKRSDSLLGHSELKSHLSLSATEISSIEREAPALPPKKRSSCGTMPRSLSQVPSFSWVPDQERKSKASSSIDLTATETEKWSKENLCLGNMSVSQEDFSKRPQPKPRTLKSLLRKTPQTVGHWLQRIGLSQYEERLISEGWDHIQFLDMMTEEDLLSAGIDEETHRDLILKSAKLLKAEQNLENAEATSKGGKSA